MNAMENNCVVYANTSFLLKIRHHNHSCRFPAPFNLYEHFISIFSTNVISQIECSTIRLNMLYFYECYPMLTAFLQIHLAVPISFLTEGETSQRVPNPGPFGPESKRSAVAPHRLGVFRRHFITITHTVFFSSQTSNRLPRQVSSGERLAKLRHEMRHCGQPRPVGHSLGDRRQSHFGRERNGSQIQRHRQTRTYKLLPRKLKYQSDIPTEARIIRDFALYRDCCIDPVDRNNAQEMMDLVAND